MRLIGHLNTEAQARRFGDFLFASGIDNQLETEGPSWAVWVHSEEDVERAGSLFREFESNPADPKYIRAANAAQERREQREMEEEQARRRFFDRGKLFPDRVYGLGLVTLLLMVLSVLVTVASQFGQNALFSEVFAIAPFVERSGFVQWTGNLHEIRAGQIWRLFTPMFVHFHVIHIVVNMLWLKDLGSQIEHQLSRTWLVVLVVAIAVPSHLAQFYVSGPTFGGMSGVVYGLLGYIWIRGRFDPESGLYVDRLTLIFMGIWFCLCLAEVIPGVANTVHAVGLLVGVMTGLVAALRARY